MGGSKHRACGCGRELTLQLERVNGINNDHRLENLRLLCPNCHSQTATYGNRTRAGEVTTWYSSVLAIVA